MLYRREEIRQEILNSASQDVDTINGAIKEFKNVIEYSEDIQQKIFLLADKDADITNKNDLINNATYITHKSDNSLFHRYANNCNVNINRNVDFNIKFNDNIISSVLNNSREANYHENNKRRY